MLNRIVLMGRLVRDPELRRTQSGIAVASFTLAVDRDFADKATGQRTADFIDIVAWRGTAEFVSKYFTKGQMAVVEGRLQLRDWQDKDNNKRRSAEVVADNVYFGGSKRDGENGGSYAQRGGSYSNSAPQNGGYQNNGYQNNSYQNNNGGYAPAPYDPSGVPAANDYAAMAGEDEGELPF